MSWRSLTVVLTLGLGLAACDSGGAEDPRLSPGERRVVDAYVKLTVLEVLHRDHADSVETLLANGAVSVDTLAVQRAADSLAAEPLRWEFVFDAITRRLTELERTPETWWQVVRGDTTRAPAP